MNTFQPIDHFNTLLAAPNGAIAVHQHIDNGGHTLSVDKYGNMVVETGFFGYSHTAVMLHAVDIDGMIKFLNEAKQYIAECQE
jgi:hypothetical protein